MAEAASAAGDGWVFVKSDELASPTWAERLRETEAAPGGSVSKQLHHPIPLKAAGSRVGSTPVANHSPAGLGLSLVRDALASGEEIDSKEMARKKYTQQCKYGRGGHTTHARHTEAQSKTNEIEYCSNGMLTGELQHKLRFGQISAPQAARALGGTCTVLKRADAQLQGDIVYMVEAPFGKDESDDDIKLTVQETRGRAPTRVKHPKCSAALRVNSPDWVHRKAICEALTKKKVQDQEAQEGVALIRECDVSHGLSTCSGSTCSYHSLSSHHKSHCVYEDDAFQPHCLEAPVPHNVTLGDYM